MVLGAEFWSIVASVVSVIFGLGGNSRFDLFFCDESEDRKKCFQFFNKDRNTKLKCSRK